MTQLRYSIEDKPPIYLCILLGIQQFLTMSGSTMVVPLIVSDAACIGEDLVGRAQLLGTLLSTSGIATLIQSTLGSRLPIIQGGAFSFLAPMLAMKNLENFKCPSFTNIPENATNGTVLIASEEHREIWHNRLVYIQGALIVAGCVEVFLGFSGIVGLLVRNIGPLTITPTIALIGLSLADDVVQIWAAKYWPVALLSMLTLVVCTIFLNNIGIPVPTLVKTDDDDREFKWKYIKFFGLFPVLISTGITWGVCALLTNFELLPNDNKAYGYAARTDLRMKEFFDAPVARIPYPFQWGKPQFHLGITIGMIAAVLPSIIESIGDYFACSRMCDIGAPPSHATNRGIMFEGIGCLVAGAFGCGPGVTSYSENVGAIAMTRVGSRRVTIIAALFLLVIGSITKVAAIFVLIPDPVMGGVLIAMLSMVASVGFSNLQFIDMNCTRNLLILGLSLFMGIAVPNWVSANREKIKTGIDEIDQTLMVLLSTGMLVGGLIGFILDNLAPGATRKQRGLGRSDDNGSNESLSEHYDLPYISQWLRRKRWAKFVPILPSFQPLFCRSQKTKETKDQVIFDDSFY